jgi:hypothetical protein
MVTVPEAARPRGTELGLPPGRHATIRGCAAKKNPHFVDCPRYGLHVQANHYMWCCRVRSTRRTTLDIAASALTCQDLGATVCREVVTGGEKWGFSDSLNVTPGMSPHFSPLSLPQPKQQ